MKKNRILSKIFIVSIPVCIVLFLSGKIIDIPHGTRQGGIVSAIGVAVILATLFTLYFGLIFLLNYCKKKND